MSPRMKYSEARMRDDVGHVDAPEQPRHDRHVVEARRADLHPERHQVALGHDVVAHLAERVLGGHIGLASGTLMMRGTLAMIGPGNSVAELVDDLRASRVSCRRTQ
jgi:hypothetical protein